MGKFGWSYPPGCSGTPYDQDDGVTDLQETILGLLEDAGIDTETNDAVMKLVRAGERKRDEAEDAAVTAGGAFDPVPELNE